MIATGYLFDSTTAKRIYGAARFARREACSKAQGLEINFRNQKLTKDLGSL